VPVDFSEPSLAASLYAADLGRSVTATVHVVHVVESIAYAPMIASAADLQRPVLIVSPPRRFR
jgi:hypothetical protein